MSGTTIAFFSEIRILKASIMLANFSLEQSLMKAKSYAKKGKTLEAQKLYETVLQNFSKNTRAQQGLAALIKSKQSNAIQSPPQDEVDQLMKLYNQEQFSAVVEQAEVLTEKYPGATIAWQILGASRFQIGMLDSAVDAYKKCISLMPSNAETYNNMGVALKNQGKLDEAMEAYKKAISLNPNYADAYNNMGVSLKDQGNLEEAIKAYKKSISLKPDYVDAYSNLGVAYKKYGQLDEAIKYYSKSLKIKPNHAKTCYNMAKALADQFKLDEALVFYKKSISSKSNYFEALSNMGLILHYQGKLDEAIEVYKKAISFKPDFAEAHQNLSHALLGSGRVREGLEEFEWRWKNPQFMSNPRHFLQPMWDRTQNLSGKRILLWSEQGVGDTINWSSFLPLVTPLAKHCIMECQEKLFPLLERSFPNVEVKPENRSLDLVRDDFDFHLPMGSLYKNFFQEFSKIAKMNPFLIPDPTRIKFWKKRLNSLGKGPYVGINWKSSNMSPERRQHYAPLSKWYPLLKLPNITFVNLQSKDFADDLTTIKNETGVTVHNFDDLDHFNNIDDVAAFSAALDIVVSIKTTVPLISSLVGTPTKLANWRQSPWNNNLTNPIPSSVEVFERDTWEPWDNTFQLIKESIFKTTKN